MLNPTQQEQRAFEVLRGTPVQDYLSRAFAECLSNLVTQRDTEALRTIQGRAQALRALLEKIDPTGFSTTNGKRG